MLRVTSALLTLQSYNQAQGQWTLIDTTLGWVRARNPVIDSSMVPWILSWQADFVYAGILMILALLIIRMIRPNRLVTLYSIAALLIVLGVFASAQHQLIAARNAEWATVMQDVRPQTVTLAYLRQCRDEIPYVFDSQTAGMAFRQLRDEEYTLGSKIPTRYGQPDLDELCAQYDSLRKEYSYSDIVLQLYSEDATGAPRVYEYADLPNNISYYGFFVKRSN